MFRSWANNVKGRYSDIIMIIESRLDIWAATWDFQQCGMCDQQMLRPACAYAQSVQSLCLSLEYSMTLRLLTKHHLEFLSWKGGCTGSSETTLFQNTTLLKITCRGSFINYWSLEEGKYQESIQSSTTADGKVTQTQENITHKRAKRSALSQQ